MNIKTNGVELYYKKLVGGTSRSLVLIHGGLGLDHSYLNSFAELLSKHFTVYLLDLRNHGASERCGVEACSLQQLSDDVKQLCNQLNIKQATVVGHSLGANIALKLAASAPEFVAHAVCLGACHYDPAHWIEQFRLKGGESAAQAAAQYYQHASAESFSHFMQHCVPHYNLEPLPESLIADIDINVDMLLYSANQLLPRANLDTASAQINTPILFIDGDIDPIVQIDHKQAICQQYKNCTQAIIHNGGHDAFYSHADECLDNILTWINKQ